MGTTIRRRFCGFHDGGYQAGDEVGGAAVFTAAQYRRGRNLHMLDPRRRSGGGLRHRLDRRPRNFRRIHLRIDDSERRRFGKAINGENRVFRFGVVAAVVFCFGRAENRRGEDQRRRGVGAAGAGDHDGVRGEDHRNICGGDAMYDSGEGVDSAGSVDEYERASGVDCS